VTKRAGLAAVFPGRRALGTVFSLSANRKQGAASPVDHEKPKRGREIVHCAWQKSARRTSPSKSFGNRLVAERPLASMHRGFATLNDRPDPFAAILPGFGPRRAAEETRRAYDVILQAFLRGPCR